MLAIARRFPNFSLTKSGKTKSCALNCVSRTRLRIADELRNRRGRLTNFSLTKSGKTKSCALNWVSRTRLRIADELRNRRGRLTNFLTNRRLLVAVKRRKLAAGRVRPAGGLDGAQASR